MDKIMAFFKAPLVAFIEWVVAFGVSLLGLVTSAYSHKFFATVFFAIIFLDIIFLFISKKATTSKIE